MILKVSLQLSIRYLHFSLNILHQTAPPFYTKWNRPTQKIMADKGANLH